MPSIEVSWGEIADRTTILRLKAARIRDAAKAQVARAELASLPSPERLLLPERWGRHLEGLVSELGDVNAALWDVEDALREAERRHGDALVRPDFVQLARSVYRLNDRRSALKAEIDELTGSKVREVKSHAAASPAGSWRGKGVLVLTHLGLGDQLACFGLVCALAERHGTAVLVASRGHEPTLRRLYACADADVDFLWVDGDADISPRFGASPTRLAALACAGLEIVALGLHRDNLVLTTSRPFWHVFYEHAGVPTHVCLHAFRGAVERMPPSALQAVPVPQGRYVVVHEDPSRGYILDRRRLPANADIVFVGGARDDDFGYGELLRRCDEFHGFDSSYAWLVQLAGLRTDAPKVMHAYVKGNAPAGDLYPTAPGEAAWITVPAR